MEFRTLVTGIIEDQIMKERETIQKRLLAKRLPLNTEDSTASHYYENGKLGVIFKEGLNSIDNAYVQDRQWSIILGSTGCGKTEIANYINKMGFGQAIIYEKYIEQKKKDLATEEGDELDEIPFPTLLEEFKKEIANADKTKDLIFDGWNYTSDELKTFLKAMGPPTYILLIEAKKETVIARYLKRSE